MSTTATAAADESHEDTLANLIGLEVYTVSGRYIGQVEDARIDFGQAKTTGLALTNVNTTVLSALSDSGDSRGIVVPYRWVHSTGDIVIITDAFTDAQTDGL